MAVHAIDGKLRFDPFELDPHEIPTLLAKHAGTSNEAPDLEAQAADLRTKGFPPSESRQFVVRVCRWGKGHRLIPRITTEDREIADALRRADLEAEQGHVSKAVKLVMKIRGLGQSFASKQLRFLRPDEAVILDSIIRGRLGYRETPEGYDAFLADCRTILAHVQALENVRRPHGEPLRICDIETAIYMKIGDEAAPRRRGRPKTEK